MTSGATYGYMWYTSEHAVNCTAYCNAVTLSSYCYMVRENLTPPWEPYKAHGDNIDVKDFCFIVSDSAHFLIHCV
jgi:hypothetical protein